MLAHLLGFCTTNISVGKYADNAITGLPIVVLFISLGEKRQLKGFLNLLQSLKTGLLIAISAAPILTAFS
jgi:hypothetical protein